MVQFADDEVGQKEDEGEGEEHERADEGEPLVVVKILALEIGHPVELSHWGDYLLFILSVLLQTKNWLLYYL